MKRFEMKQLREAIEFSMQGGQALHVHTLNSGHRLFRRYPVIGHYFDQDTNRLIYVSRRLGVRVIKVEREGTPKQHIDLCGKPFELACAVAVEHSVQRIGGTCPACSEDLDSAGWCLRCGEYPLEPANR